MVDAGFGRGSVGIEDGGGGDDQQGLPTIALLRVEWSEQKR